MALEFVANDFRADPSVVLAAVASNWRAIKFSSEDMQTDRRVVETAAVASEREISS